jgi:formate dehydrogenase major subunit
VRRAIALSASRGRIGRSSGPFCARWDLIVFLAGLKEIWNEVRSLWPVGAASLIHIRRGPVYNRPCLGEDHPGTSVLHKKRFACGDRAALCVIDRRPPEEATSEEFPILLTTGRLLYRFNTAAMRMRSDNVRFRPH